MMSPLTRFSAMLVMAMERLFSISATVATALPKETVWKSAPHLSSISRLLNIFCVFDSG